MKMKKTMKKLLLKMKPWKKVKFKGKINFDLNFKFVYTKIF